MSNISCILYPPTLDYRYLVQRPQQLMTSFSELNIPVYYINNPSPHLPPVTGVEKINADFYLFNKVDPIPYLKGMRPVVYFSAPAHVDLVQQYNPSLVVFDSVDEPSDEFEPWKPFYHRAVTSSDLVFTTSEKLYQLAASLNSNTYLIPNGCDYDYFYQASTKSLPVPDDVAGISGPVIGYIGVIATWCDLELVDRVAATYPDYNLVMVGPLYNVNDVPRRPNIHWLGFKPYDQLASYAQMFDVGIIPFKSSNMTEAVNPIKMWEYMGAGLPVVSTNIPEAGKYPEAVLCSENADIFIQNINNALYNDSPEKRENRIKLAAANSWRARAQQIINIIENKLAEKGSTQQPIIEEILDDALSYPPEHFGSFDYSQYVNMLAPYRKVLISRRPFFRYSKFALNKNYNNLSGRRKTNLGAQKILTVTGKTAFKYQTERSKNAL
ncbi:MAG: glycosyltransferase [Syntrophomonadaceae bacterium]|nr:glycosyltransferase [Syntrophomonadaceae bacterium]MDD3023683.1 glycosyltransferase [Syntrophomonadaceae bacterium]